MENNMSKKSRAKDTAIRESIQISKEIEKRKTFTSNQKLHSKPLKTNLGDLLIEAMWNK
jgi:hypothetical protein